MTKPMKTLAQHTPAELKSLEQQLTKDLELQAGNKLSLDLTRGKPAPDQLSLSDDLENQIHGDYFTEDGTDARNYGGLRGISEARKLGGQLLDMPAENIIAFGNSSLTLMHMVADIAKSHGLWQDERRWQTSASIKFITPVPGYDRHFVLCESLGIEMVNVDMLDDGPDMNAVYKLVANDPSIKGIWCVPKYSNPTGCIYSPQTVAALAELPNRAAASDFVVMWDNAYAVHDLSFPMAPLTSLADAAAAAGTEDHMVQFASCSKITHAGGGVAFLAASETVLMALESRMQAFTIGPDKVNQLRHTRFLKGRLVEHMADHARLIKPKFELVQQVLNTQLGTLAIASWTEPEGGYFVSLNTAPGLASQVIELANQVGLRLTPAGSTFPHGQDPEDSNIRIAPTFADLADLAAAMDVLVLCIKLASIRAAIVSHE